MSDELRECPFCGETARLEYNGTMCCDGCGAQGPKHFNFPISWDEAIAAWNRRAWSRPTYSTEELRELLAKLKAEGEIFGVTVLGLILNPQPPITQADIEKTKELAEKYGWELLRPEPPPLPEGRE